MRYRVPHRSAATQAGLTPVLGRMSKIVVNLAKAVVLLFGIPAIGIATFDYTSVRPRLGQVEAILAQAPRLDASPPQLVRDLIDASERSPTPYAAKLVVSRVYPETRSNKRLIRELLWRILLPMHLGKSSMYGLFATLSSNGTDTGLSSFSALEFGKPLDQLTPIQAATTVAVTRGPSWYLSDRNRLNERALFLLKKSGHVP